MPKLQGLAYYTETHSTIYRRLEVIAKIEDQLRVLDLADPVVRKAVTDAKDAKDAVSLYASAFASNY